MSQIELIIGSLVPRKLRDPLEISANHLRFHRFAAGSLETPEFALYLGARFLGKLQLRELVAKIRDLLARVVVAELLLNRLELLAQIHLALALAEFLLNLRLDVFLSLQQTNLALDMNEGTLHFFRGQAVVLATGGYGTALGVVRSAHARGKLAMLWVDETRPVMQGSRLTAWECVREGIPHKLIADVVAASVMARGEVDLVVTGADRIAANGDTANKIGTYALAVLARHHGVPFYIAAPFSTIDPTLASGAEIPIEERDALEVRRVGPQQTAPESSPVYNPAFDVTPAALIAAIITERGVFRPPYRFE